MSISSSSSAQRMVQHASTSVAAFCLFKTCDNLLAAASVSQAGLQWLLKPRGRGKCIICLQCVVEEGDELKEAPSPAEPKSAENQVATACGSEAGALRIRRVVTLPEQRASMAPDVVIESIVARSTVTSSTGALINGEVRKALRSMLAL